jgi:3-deoxy-manno-octulosonate cytidylyltransferase (CMP-KDO synthetase)
VERVPESPGAGPLKMAVVIPARYAAERLPGKPLAPLAGKTLVRRVYESVASWKGGEILVACDDDRIAREVESAGGRAVMTSASCRSGTDRVAEAARNMDADVVVNMQGDELFASPAMMEEVTAPFASDPALKMATLCAPLRDEAALMNPAVVKVVRDESDFALYFSRSPIPHVRSGVFAEGKFWRHLGIYAYRKEFLLEFAAWPESSLERMERLEQLRALERGVKIKCMPTASATMGVDTPEDAKEAEKRLKENP